MDPFLIIFLTLFVLSTSSFVAIRIKKHQQTQKRLALQSDLRAHHRLEDTRLSLFDIFWDLGASDFALELMAHHDLLPQSQDETYGAISRLKTLIQDHGGYNAFLEDSLDAIQEFFQDHRFAGDRRNLPGLTGARTRTVALPRLESDQAPPPKLQAPTAAHVKERREIRLGRQEPGLDIEQKQDVVDIDHVANFSAGAILRSLIDGNLSGQIDKWFKLRNLRHRRQQLDRRLEEFYDFYAEIALSTPNFYDPLYDAQRRWHDEVTRLKLERRQRRWAFRPFAAAADVLFDDAINLAQTLARRAYDASFFTIEKIHDHARQGQKPMAGYLVYLNRHAFFAGRFPAYADYARKIEFATHRVREELIDLRRQGVI